MSARLKFTNDLENLRSNIYKMSKLLSLKFEELVIVLEENNRVLAQELIYSDVDINKIEIDINDQAVSLITQQSPVASDLRLIISCIKIAEDLERIGDNISNIAEVSRKTQILNKQILLRLTTMIRLAKLMLDDAMVAMKKDDLSLVNEIIERDQDIDQIFVQVTLSDIYEETDAFVTGQIQLTAKYLERIGDHIENIGEHIYFTLTGKRYK
ncbi:phosphate signaling complex protein PhoU [Phocicoccus pinnipedialis]|uniref:Phosphate-specific transport system accessory protein PhoU n=1 Tax=Phocicoccus pinnipedialis TaxID=110845 RepID=A0A6V7REX8_9BACL|nr:phosphate signaling complex protein PhoU [Jeotgalicoccus pinnipedialis]CAD2075992.1 Phosphate-specific transport system accessory protein PhoU [Jeotgalicoccus pinnipedialis]